MVLEVIVNSWFIARGKNSRVDYTYLMKYLTMEGNGLETEDPHYHSSLGDRGGFIRYHINPGVVVSYEYTYSTHVDPGKTYCKIEGPREQVDRVKELMLRTLESGEHRSS